MCHGQKEGADGSTLLLPFSGPSQAFYTDSQALGLRIIVLLIGGALDVAACGTVHAGTRGGNLPARDWQLILPTKSFHSSIFLRSLRLLLTAPKSGFPVPTDDLGIRSICELSYGSFFPRHGNGKVAAGGAEGAAVSETTAAPAALPSRTQRSNCWQKDYLFTPFPHIDPIRPDLAHCTQRDWPVVPHMRLVDRKVCRKLDRLPLISVAGERRTGRKWRRPSISPSDDGSLPSPKSIHRLPDNCTISNTLKAKASLILLSRNSASHVILLLNFFRVIYCRQICVWCTAMFLQSVCVCICVAPLFLRTEQSMCDPIHTRVHVHVREQGHRSLSKNVSACEDPRVGVRTGSHKDSEAGKSQWQRDESARKRGTKANDCKCNNESMLSNSGW